MINDAFLKGYNESIPETNNHIKRCDLYKLLGSFFGTYVVLIEYDDNEWFLQEKSNSVLMLNKLL